MITKACLIVVCSSFLCLSQCDAQQNEFSWLLGTWKMKDKNVYEIWKKADGQSLAGVSFKLNSSDTIVNERMTIVYKRNGFYYVPDVAGDQKPIDFKIIKYNASGFTASNPEHDFPKVIEYHWKINNDHPLLYASIKGNLKVISYQFEKVKP